MGVKGRLAQKRIVLLAQMFENVCASVFKRCKITNMKTKISEKSRRSIKHIEFYAYFTTGYPGLEIAHENKLERKELGKF
jgi:hypothetical protein